jgi:hypothetical protein
VFNVKHFKIVLTDQYFKPVLLNSPLYVGFRINLLKPPRPIEIAKLPAPNGRKATPDPRNIKEMMANIDREFVFDWQS